MPKLSIIIPCYNYGIYLERTIKSIYNNKTDLEYDITVVDDCSTDDSFLLEEKLSRNYKFTLMRTSENKKVARARNFGITNTQGSLIICLDADDVISSNYIQENYNNIKNFDCDISYPNMQFFGEKNFSYYIPEFSVDTFVSGHNYVVNASMYKRQVWIDNLGYDEQIYGYEDYEFWINAAKAGKKFKHCPDAIFYYRKDGPCLSLDYEKHLPEIQKYLHQKHAGFYKGGAQ